MRSQINRVPTPSRSQAGGYLRTRWPNGRGLMHVVGLQHMGGRRDAVVRSARDLSRAHARHSSWHIGKGFFFRLGVSFPLPVLCEAARPVEHLIGVVGGP